MPTETAEKKPANKNLPAPISDKMGPQQMAEMLKAMVPNKDANLVGDYMKLEPGEEKRVVFIEKTEINAYNGKPGEMSPAVRLLTEDGKFAVNADKVLVSALSNIPERTPVLIICTGTEQGKNGDYSTFEVYPLVGTGK